MSIGKLPIFATKPEPQGELTINLSEGMIESLEQISEEYDVTVDKLIESALYYWLLRGHSDNWEDYEEN